MQIIAFQWFVLRAKIRKAQNRSSELRKNRLWHLQNRHHFSINIAINTKSAEGQICQNLQHGKLMPFTLTKGSFFGVYFWGVQDWAQSSDVDLQLIFTQQKKIYQSRVNEVNSMGEKSPSCFRQSWHNWLDAEHVPAWEWKGFQRSKRQQPWLEHAI